jgi:hypothetical protein
MRNTVVLNKGPWIQAEMLPAPLKAFLNKSASAIGKPAQTSEPLPLLPTNEILPLWQVEKAAIENAIRHCQDNTPPSSRYARR